jgi:membrane protease YdiL (CAAX protease family)
VGGVVLGWLYWKKGLEAAIVAHLAADAFIYLGVASVL